jgi:hypothetical protein
VGALLLVNALLVLPWWAATGVPGRVWIALEALALVGLVAVLPPRGWARWLARVAAVALGAAVLLLLADAAARQSLDRGLNLYLDLHLAPSIVHLLQGALGPVRGVVALVAMAVVGVGLLAAVGTLLSRVVGRRTSGGERVTGWRRMGGRGGVGLAGAVLLAVSGAALSGVPVPVLGLGRGWTERPAWVVVDQQIHQLTRMLQVRERFQSELARLPEVGEASGARLQGLEGRDVILAFVESYGMTALEDPRYAPVVRPRLETMARRLEAAGLHLATGSLVSPTQGGQSWLAHASVLSGLWIADQLRYDLLLASGRATLVHDFQRTGYRTAAIMPAITLAWPEGDRLGYDRVWARKDIDYRGPELNWVTMPDQFTWSFLETEVRPAPGPLFAELNLISSHAPWTPVLPVLDDWEGLGSGEVFDRWEGTGETPERLWRNPDRVREAYPRSVEYAVHAALAWAERYLDEDALLLLMGDHQPAPLITGEDASRAVPVHVVSGDPSLVEPFLEWGFAPGPFPPATPGGRFRGEVGTAPEPDTPRGMDAFRPWFVKTFAEPPAPPAPAAPAVSAVSGGSPSPAPGIPAAGGGSHGS